MRIRTCYNRYQLLELENTFQTMHYISTSNRRLLAERLNLNEKQVIVWFQNRRSKEKRLKSRHGEREISKSPLIPIESISPSSTLSSSMLRVPSMLLQASDHSPIQANRSEYSYLPLWKPQSWQQQSTFMCHSNCGRYAAMPPVEYTPNAANFQPIKIEPVDEELRNSSNGMDEFAHHYEFVGTENGNQMQATMFDAYKQLQQKQQQRSDWCYENVNSPNHSIMLHPAEQIKSFVDKFHMTRSQCGPSDLY